ncbi:MAG: hypothetical protein K2X62_11095 [Beijerinckiaceae bacterium]|nr:hypothetical protein [Beijerinckiaceae bacterium]
MRLESTASTTSVAPFRIVRQGRTGVEIRHESGLVFAFMLNSAHTGLVDCRRPAETSQHEQHRAAARRFAESRAHAAGLIWCPSAAA